AAATLGGGGSAVPTGSGRDFSTADALTSSAAKKDIAALKLDASLENLAVFAYGAALKAAPKGKFGKVPAAVAEFAMHAMDQHADHAEAFNAALVNAGSKAYTKPDPALTPAVLKMFKDTNSVPELAKLALTLENTAAATYVKQMKTLRSLEALNAVATIAPVERQHAAILSFVLGEYPVPDTFVKLGPTSTSLGARPTSDLK
uniref:ferritin-like domain-containing protein n=1 Tax=Sporichthya sp. TaxID=65475 RepID=UPI001801EAEC